MVSRISFVSLTRKSGVGNTRLSANTEALSPYTILAIASALYQSLQIWRHDNFNNVSYKRCCCSGNILASYSTGSWGKILHSCRFGRRPNLILDLPKWLFRATARSQHCRGQGHCTLFPDFDISFHTLTFNRLGFSSRPARQVSKL